VVVLATPVRHIIETIAEIGPLLKPGTLVIDFGSTKREIVAALADLPEGVQAVGGHPMCGKEVGGLEQADAALFRGAMFVLTPTASTTDGGMALAREIVEAIGAHALVLDAERHDRAAAPM
jgi:prephenate dehydrogenase